MDGIDVGKLATDLASVERSLRAAQTKLQAIQAGLPNLVGFRIVVIGPVQHKARR